MVRWQRRQWRQHVVQVGGPMEEAAMQHIHTAQGQVNILAGFMCAGRSDHAAVNFSRLCPLIHSKHIFHTQTEYTELVPGVTITLTVVHTSMDKQKNAIAMF